MVKSETVYIFLFTLTNISLTLYLQYTLKIYRQQRKLPFWAAETRSFLEKLDDAIKPGDIQSLTDEISDDPPQPKNFIENFILSADFSSLSFLQISPSPNTNVYDMRDDYQLRHRTPDQPASTTAAAKESEFYDPSKFQDDLINIESDEKNMECNLNTGVDNALLNRNQDKEDVDQN